MSAPPKNARVLIAKPLGFELRVVKPSGLPIAGAKVDVEWDFQNPYEAVDDVQTLTTDDRGVVTIPVLDPGAWLTSSDCIGVIRVSKRHHGPVTKPGTPFKNGIAEIFVKYQPTAPNRVQVLQAEAPADVRWGSPRTVGPMKDALEVTLMEGGTLGVEHPSIRTRRLSAPHLPASPPTTISQIDEELLFHIAHGSVALTESTDYQLAHDDESGDFDPCVAGKCNLKVIAATGSPPTVPKVTARNAVLGGLRAIHIAEFVSPASIKLSGSADTRDLNPRLMVGIIRFANMLRGRGASTMITVGFLRDQDDAHGHGRAVDFSGVILGHLPGLTDKKNKIDDSLDPNCVLRKSLTRVCVAESDFIVFYHWGLVKLLVDTSTGRVRRADNAITYRNDFDASSSTLERLVYRLSDLPAEGDRHANHKLTDKHYQLARDLFGASYAFFSQEFAHRDNFLGPPATHAELQKPAGAILLARVTSDDASAARAVPGSVQGFVLHPDYPAPDGGGPRRQSHANHIHANFGATKPTSSGDFER